jgi:hypothetical protein
MADKEFILKLHGETFCKTVTLKVMSLKDMFVRWICCEDGRWIELAQDRVQCQALVLDVWGSGSIATHILNLGVTWK